MDTERDPSLDPAALGIDAGHHDGFGEWRTPSAQTLELLRDAMDLGPGEVPSGAGSLVVVRGPDGPLVTDDGRPVPSVAGTSLRLEDGTVLALDGALPPDLPIGYHTVLGGHDADGRNGPASTEQPLIVSPGRCHLPADLRIWGVTAQLYAARSSRSWGIGDLDDLGTLVRWARDRGAGLVGLNPLHAPSPSPRPPDSPYSPSSRRWRDPSMIAVEQVPGFAELPDAAELAAAGRRLNDGTAIDRAAAWALKRSALEALWPRVRAVGSEPDFERFLAENGDGLERWGVFCAVADQVANRGDEHGWSTWPADLQHPGGSGVAKVAREQVDDVRFWCWLQWLINRQLAGSGASDVVLSDLAVGFAADGFDAWEWQDLVALGARIGAPPDPLGRDGQDWGLPPFIPWKLAEAGYRPLAETMRAAFRHARGVRIDHVMGLFRLFWLPPGGGAADGAYVRFRGHDLLHVLAIESSRAGGLVVGEDLGTVEGGVRESLADAGVLSTRLLWFEDGPPASWPRQAMAAVTTHDLPTVAGVWSGTDLDDLETAGVTLPSDGDAELRHRLRVAAHCTDDAAVDEVVVDAHAAVAASPSMVATAALDDLLGARHRPNVPGTIDEHPNWRIPLPVPLDDLDGHPLAEAVADAMRTTR